MRHLTALALVAALGGCESLGIGSGDVAGALGAGFGGAAGGYLGSHVGSGLGQTAATIAGASLGALFGSAVARKLAAGDLELMRQATQQSLETAPTGTTTTWRNPDTGHSGAVVAGPATGDATAPCRPFQATVELDGTRESAGGTACRQPDGSWQVQPG